MDFAYTFSDPSTLYLNLTSRCTNRCSFCVGRFTDSLGSGVLRGGPEPDLEALLAAIERQGGAGTFEEVVFCGLGEPTFRLDLILAAGPGLRNAGARVRLNTNGHGRLIHGRDVLVELAAVVDVLSVSLNAPTPERYAEICLPKGLPGRPVGGREAWEATVDLLFRAPPLFGAVRASVVGHCLTPSELSSCAEMAWRAGAQLVVR